MKQLINIATRDFQDKINLIDSIETGKLLNKHNDLYENSKIEFSKTCNICYEVPTKESYCNCKILCAVLCKECASESTLYLYRECNTTEKSITRTNLLEFTKLYEDTQSRAIKKPVRNVFNGVITSDVCEVYKKSDGNDVFIIDVELKDSSAVGKVVKATLIILESIQNTRKSISIGNLVTINHRLQVSKKEEGRYSHYFDIDPNCLTHIDSELQDALNALLGKTSMNNDNKTEFSKERTPLQEDNLFASNSNSNIVFEEGSVSLTNSGGGLPAPLSVNIHDKKDIEKLNKITNLIKGTLKNSPKLTFPGILTGIKSEVGLFSTEENFDFITKAWNTVSNDKVSISQRNELYNEFFGSIDSQNFRNSFSNNSIEIKESNPIIEEQVVEKTDVVTDFILPIIMYLFYISVPIGIFFNTFFKDIFNFRDALSYIYYKEYREALLFFYVIGLLFGLFFIKEIGKNTKNQYMKILYSEKSIKFHFIVSLILIALVLYYLTIAIALIILISLLISLGKHLFRWGFKKDLFYKWVQNKFKIKK